jgi:hypothetical protein
MIYTFVRASPHVAFEPKGVERRVAGSRQIGIV